jgi:hypothetical protein
MMMMMMMIASLSFLMKRYETATLSSNSNALTTLDTLELELEDDCDEKDESSCTLASSSEKSSASILPDYTKSIATLPDTSPLECFDQTDQQRQDNDDSSAAANLDFFPPIEHPSDIQVQFVLRVPTTSKLKSGRQRSDVPQNILSKSSRNSTTTSHRVPRANRKSSRQRSVSSDNNNINSNSNNPSDSNNKDYELTSIGDPTMSRENSVENLEKMGNDWAGILPPISKRRNSVESSLSPSLDTNNISTHDEELMPLKKHDSEIITPPKSESDDEGLGYGYGQAYSDGEIVEHRDHQNQPRRKQRMQRRSSFVAGSKIERFDGGEQHSTSRHNNNPPNNSNHHQQQQQQPRRGRNQHRGGVANDTASCTEWKIDLMVNGYSSNKASSHD